MFRLLVASRWSQVIELHSFFFNKLSVRDVWWAQQVAGADRDFNRSGVTKYKPCRLPGFGSPI